jgi:sugar-specific transcriptional regulator TrmB
VDKKWGKVAKILEGKSFVEKIEGNPINFSPLPPRFFPNNYWLK